MSILFSETAKKDLDSMNKEQKLTFLKHVKKIHKMPERRHMKYGIPYHVEEVTKQSRIIYNKENQKTYIIRCFTKHKDYERWYETYK